MSVQQKILNSLVSLLFCCNTAHHSYEEFLLCCMHFVISHVLCWASSSILCFLLPLESMAPHLRYIFIILFHFLFSISSKLSHFLPRIHPACMGRKPGIKVRSAPHVSVPITQFKCSLNFLNVALNLSSLTWILHFCFHNRDLKYIIHMLRGGVLWNAVLPKSVLCRVIVSLQRPS